MRIQDAKPGLPVVYRARHPNATPEDGVITSVGMRMIFVRFTGQHPDAHGKPCHPDHLEIVTLDRPA